MNNVKTIKSEVKTVSILAIIAAYYSRILEQTVTVSQTKSLINAQCAFVALVMPADLGITYRIIALAWFGMALLQCKIKLQDSNED